MTRHPKRLPAFVSAFLAWAVLLCAPARAQAAAGYYAGKQVKMIIGLGTGGG
jgi:hypothetical protein